MTIAFLTNLISLHQSHVADELYRLTGGNYTFIEVEKPNEEIQKKLPTEFDIYKKPYLLQAWRNEENKRKAMELCKSVDVLMSGGGLCVIPYESERLKKGKLTFEPSERQLKRGVLNAFSKTSRMLYKMYWTAGHENLYKLCSSAFTANDMYFLHPFFKDKCYKWGYFTQVAELDIDRIISARKQSSSFKIMWVARFLNWKHPFMMLQLAKGLLAKGVKDFVIDMVGTGPEEKVIREQIANLNLGEYVKLLGAIPNEQVHQLMKEHTIFCFTSDKREGWGAVLSEAMSNGCACVSSDLIGAAPFLIQDGKNGLLFKTKSVEDLISKVSYLMEHSDVCDSVQRAAYKTMIEKWNPRVAAKNFYDLSKSMLEGNPITIEDGPCSKAEPIKGKTFAS